MPRPLKFVLCWCYNVLVAIDQLGSAIMGWPADQTISSYLWHADQEGRWLGKLGRPVVDLMFRFWEKDHCRKAWESDPDERANAVKHMVARWEEGRPIVWRPGTQP